MYVETLWSVATNNCRAGGYLKLGERHWSCQQLPIVVKRPVTVDELLGISQKVVVVRLEHRRRLSRRRGRRFAVGRLLVLVRLYASKIFYLQSDRICCARVIETNSDKKHNKSKKKTLMAM